MSRPFLLRSRADGCLLSPGMTEDDYVKLRNEWYRKLKEECDFEDIEVGICNAGVFGLPIPTGAVSAPPSRRQVEVTAQPTGALPGSLVADNRRTRMASRDLDADLNSSTRAEFESIYEYWAMCRQFLYASAKYAPAGRARRVWALYCEGVKGREISRRLQMPNSNVNRTLRRLDAAMRQWWHDTADQRQAEIELRLVAEASGSAT